MINQLHRWIADRYDRNVGFRFVALLLFLLVYWLGLEFIVVLTNDNWMRPTAIIVWLLGLSWVWAWWIVAPVEAGGEGGPR